MSDWSDPVADFCIHYIDPIYEKGYQVSGEISGHQPFESIESAYKAMMDMVTDLTLEGSKVIHIEVTTRTHSEMNENND